MEVHPRGTGQAGRRRGGGAAAAVSRTNSAAASLEVKREVWGAPNGN